MRVTLILAMLLVGCLAPVETEEPDPYVYEDEPEVPPGWGAKKGGEPDMCGYADIKGGVKIPIECYWGPPRHDDVEDVVNPWVEYQAPAAQYE